MPDLDEFADEVATELMLDAARSVTERQVKNMVGGHENLAGLTDGEYDDFVHAVLASIQTADITIDASGRG
jgi:hypothetical protein